MITPKMKAPKMKWMPISSVMNALARMPTSTIAIMSGVSEPDFWKRAPSA